MLRQQVISIVIRCDGKVIRSLDVEEGRKGSIKGALADLTVLLHYSVKLLLLFVG